MDRNNAAEALAEIERRSQQTIDRGGPRRVPLWYVLGSAAAITLPWGTSDVSGWRSTALTLTAGAAFIVLTVALERSVGIRLRMGSLRWPPMVAFAFAVVGAAILAGSVLRLYDVPAAGAIGGLAAGLVWAVGLRPAQKAAVKQRSWEGAGSPLQREDAGSSRPHEAAGSSRSWNVAGERHSAVEERAPDVAGEQRARGTAGEPGVTDGAEEWRERGSDGGQKRS